MVSFCLTYRKRGRDGNDTVPAVAEGRRKEETSIAECPLRFSVDKESSPFTVLVLLLLC